MTPDTPQQALPLPKFDTDNAPKPPVFGQAPMGSKPKQKSATPVALGANASPSVANVGYKRLVGQ